MNRKLWTAAALGLALLAGASGASANDSEICEKESGDIAIRACTRAITSGKLSRGQLAWAYHNRGVEYEIKEDPDRALADYTQALKIDPKRAGSLVGRGNAYSNKGDFTRAFADYNAAIRLDPADVNAYYNRGLAYSRTKDIARARADYQRAVEMRAETAKHRSAQQLAREELAKLSKQ